MLELFSVVWLVGKAKGYITLVENAFEVRHLLDVGSAYCFVVAPDYLYLFKETV